MQPVAAPTRLIYGPKQRDELVKATQSLLQPSQAKTLANDPLQSDRISTPTATVSGTDNYPFPAPGLAYYLAEAMMLGIQADAQMMQAYNSEENLFYQNIETQWDVYANKDMAFYQQEGQKALLSGALSTVSAVGAIGLVAYTGYKTSQFASETTELMGQKTALTNKLAENTGVFELEEAPPPIQGEIREEPLRTNEPLSSQKVKVNQEFMDNQKKLSQEREDALSLPKRLELREQINEEYDQKIKNLNNGPFEVNQNDLKNLKEQREEALSKVPEGELTETEKAQIQKNYEEKLGNLEKTRTTKLELIKEEETKLIRAREDKTTEIEAHEKKRGEFGTKMGGLQAIPQLVAQFSGIGTGVIALQQQANTVQSRDTADKIKTLNQTVLQGLNRQWTTLAGYVDGMLSSYVESIKGFSQAMQRV
ncbi:MAG: hypothetical protein JSR80_03585 [Verrucomicrobia bacterium]|nr:hypothetical protein [Verrucomicrobiota bacterium]